MKVFQAILLSLCGCIAAGAEGGVQPSPSTLTERDRLELQTLTRMLADPDRSTKTKSEAAGLLLTKPYPAATQALVGFLGDTTNRPAAIAVARAIAETGPPHKSFVAPLLAMLTGEDAAIRTVAASALGTYKEVDVLQQLSRIATNTRAAEPIRLAALSALSRRIDKQSIETMIALLADSEISVKTAAGAGLEKLTGIRRFGADPRRWRRWWQANRDKPRQQWLADQVETLTRQTEAQERHIAELHTRLEAALRKRYAATSPPDQPAVVLALIRDPLAEVRLVGLKLAAQRTVETDALTEETPAVVRSLLTNDDPRVRAAAALLAADLSDMKAVALIMDRLGSETAPSARTALIAALGRLGDVRAIDVLLTALAGEPNGAAIEAGLAVELIVGSSQLTPAQINRAVEVITLRYGTDLRGQPKLRRALLGAMRSLNRREFAQAMRRALTDADARIRLEAIRGLQAMDVTEAAGDIAPLAADSDRGIRQAAIAAMEALGDPSHLEPVLARTLEGVENDPVVRQQAWEAALTLLKRADNERLAEVAESLADRPDAREYRISMLQMLDERLAGDTPAQIAIRLQLTDVLLASSRPAQAAEILAATHAQTDDSPQAGRVWLAWMTALLAADDVACLAHMANQSDNELFNAAGDLLAKRLAELLAATQYQPLITLADSAGVRLAKRLGDPRRRQIMTLRTTAAQRQQQADRAEIARLIAALGNGEGDQRDAAAAALLAMGSKAVGGLLEYLRTDLAAESPNPAAQGRIIKLLATLAPELTGFDEAGDAKQKLATIDAWLARVNSAK